MSDPASTFSFRSRLGSGEKLLWEGQPAQGLLFNDGSGPFAIVFSLLWAGFAIFWNVGVWASDGPIFFRLWGLPFLLVAAYITVGRFLVDRHKRARIRYAVTNQRVLIARTDKGSLRALDIKHLPTLDLDEKADGSGTISFSIDPYAGLLIGRRPGGPFGSGTGDVARFFLISGARRVYDLIRKAAEAPSA